MYESETEVAMPWVYNDAGYPGRTTKRGRHIPGNQVVTALAIASGQKYWDVLHAIQRRQINYVRGLRHGRIKEAGSAISDVGVWPEVSKGYLRELGWTWTPTMSVGSGVTVHLAYDELPDEPVLVCSVSKSLVTVFHGVVQAPHDPSRDGTRAVYGYWTPPRG
jgi:hypothetical protein